MCILVNILKAYESIYPYVVIDINVDVVSSYTEHTNNHLLATTRCVTPFPLPLPCTFPPHKLPLLCIIPARQAGVVYSQNMLVATTSRNIHKSFSSISGIPTVIIWMKNIPQTKTTRGSYNILPSLGILY